MVRSCGEYKKEVKNLKVEVILDSKKKTLTIRDHGIGMTQDEVNKYINEVAFSRNNSLAKGRVHTSAITVASQSVLWERKYSPLEKIVLI